MDDTYSYVIAEDLLRTGALSVSPTSPFLLSSGVYCPMYCDNRLTLSHPEVRDRITNAFVEELNRFFHFPESIVGVATAGIPWAAMIADRLKLPMAYVRAKPKGHGKESQIEGKLRAGQTTVVIEDLVFSGASSRLVLDAVREVTNRPPVAVMSIFTYNIPGVSESFADAGSPLVNLSDLNTMLSLLDKQNRLRASDAMILKNFQQDPKAWSDSYKS